MTDRDDIINAFPVMLCVNPGRPWPRSSVSPVGDCDCHNCRAQRAFSAVYAERDRLRLDKARHMARGAVFAQLCSYLARNGQWVLANEWLARGDAAMADVRPEDLVRIAMPPKREKETP